MTPAPEPARFAVERGGLTIAGEATPPPAGEGPPVVLLHGLTATRRYVLMGSRILPRRGYRVVGYDARGHGESDPAPEREAYGYRDQVTDLEAVLHAAGADRAVLVGNSMGAATALAFALAHPDRVAALVQITPGYTGRPREDAAELRRWDALAEGLERGGVEGFVEAYRPAVGERWRETVLRVVRQRLERHRHPQAVADALRVVPRSSAFEGLEVLRAVEVPTLVVGSRDDADPGHPLRVAQAYAERLPRAELLVEAPGKSPLAWQGAQLSRAVVEFLERWGIRPRG